MYTHAKNSSLELFFTGIIIQMTNFCLCVSPHCALARWTCSIRIQRYSVRKSFGDRRCIGSSLFRRLIYRKYESFKSQLGWTQIVEFHNLKITILLFICTVYTEHQKKHHFFRVALTKIHAIKINNIWTQISFNTP